MAGAMRKIKRRLKIFLFNLLYHKLWIRIVVILLVIVTVPLALMGILLIDTSQKVLRNSVLNNHKEIVIRAAEEIGLYIKGPESVLSLTAGMLSITHAEPFKQETILVELALNQPIFMRVSSVDLSGQEIATSELGKQLTRSFSNEILQEIGEGRTYISKVKVIGNHTPYLTMAVPVKETGRIFGALIADVNLRGLWGIVDNIKLDKTGRAFLVSDDGILIAHYDKKRVLQNENIKGEEDVRSVLEGKSGAIELEDKAAKKWISSYAPIADVGWGIVLRQEQQEAYSLSKVMGMKSWVIIILSELAAILMSIFIAKILARPIKFLASKIKSVAAGNLDDKIEIKRHDEIGKLIKSFNYMTKGLKRAKDRERLSAIGEASAWIAHEFKNSLVAIKPFVQLFPQKHRDKKFVQLFSKLVPAEIKRWEHMLRELSDFSANFGLKLVKTNIREVITSTLAIMKEEFLEKKINVEYTDKNAEFYITADPIRLEQVFRNLIINAVNAMPDGGLLTISSDLIKNDSRNGSSYYLEVRIKDTGIGMSVDSLGRLFEPFRTTKKGGMGLGLTISRKIIDKHGGSIRGESTAGAGTTFIVKLPAEVTEGIIKKEDRVYKK